MRDWLDFQLARLQENVMFTSVDLVMIRKALILMQKSVSRLANKEEQPESVVAEYRKVYGDVSVVIRKIEAAHVEQEAKEKLQASSKKGA